MATHLYIEIPLGVSDAALKCLSDWFARCILICDIFIDTQLRGLELLMLWLRVLVLLLLWFNLKLKKKLIEN